jgi:hypothetical protein
MFTSTQIELVKKINASPYKIILTTAGGGSSFVGDFLSISGGSNTILGAFVPYDAQITATILSFYGDAENIKLVSKDCAECLCAHSIDLFESYGDFTDEENELFLGNEPSKVISISCTASLAKDNEREGRIHEAYISLLFADSMREEVLIEHILLNSTRENEEKELAAKILDILVKVCETNER